MKKLLEEMENYIIVVENVQDTEYSTLFDLQEYTTEQLTTLRAIPPHVVLIRDFDDQEDEIKTKLLEKVREWKRVKTEPKIKVLIETPNKEIEQYLPTTLGEVKYYTNTGG